MAVFSLRCYLVLCDATLCFFFRPRQQLCITYKTHHRIAAKHYIRSIVSHRCVRNVWRELGRLACVSRRGSAVAYGLISKTLQCYWNNFHPAEGKRLILIGRKDTPCLLAAGKWPWMHTRRHGSPILGLFSARKKWTVVQSATGTPSMFPLAASRLALSRVPGS